MEQETTHIYGRDDGVPMRCLREGCDTPICQLIPGRDPEREIPTRENVVSSKSRFLGRHIPMMAFGSAIGSGLLFGTGKLLYLAGPVSLVLAYLLTALIPFAVLITLGEMISVLPISGGFFALANRFLSRKIGFICGWTYWFASSISYAAQLIAAKGIITYWLEDKYSTWIWGLWILLFLAIPVIVNNFNIKCFGEIEYCLTLVKIATIVGIIILGILLPMELPVGTRLLGTDLSNKTLVLCPNSTLECVVNPGFKNWQEGGFISYLATGSWGRFLGFWACCCQAIFSYSGIEIIAIAANDTERQRETLPRVVRRVAYRLPLYYVGAVFVLGLNVSANDPVLVASLSQNDLSYIGPFVLMVQRAGIPVLGHVINAVALFAAVSVANANLYITTRTLYALAIEGHFFRRARNTMWNDVPVYCLGFSVIPAFFAYLSLLGTDVAFDALSKASSACTLITWIVICATYIRFRTVVYNDERLRHEIEREAKSCLQPYLAWVGLGLCTIIFFFQGFEVFSRHNHIWSVLSSSWGDTIAPWIVVIILFILMVGWLIVLMYQYRVTGNWNMLIPRQNLTSENVIEGIADKLDPAIIPSKWYKRLLNRVLDSL